MKLQPRFRLLDNDDVRPDPTPMADIIFNLLIFFMISSSFILEPGIRVNLPRAVTSEAQLKKDVILTLTQNKAIFINEKPVMLDELGSAIASSLSEDQGKLLIVKADETLPHGFVVHVMDIAKLAGAQRLAIATEQPK